MLFVVWSRDSHSVSHRIIWRCRGWPCRGRLGPREGTFIFICEYFSSTHSTTTLRTVCWLVGQHCALFCWFWEVEQLKNNNKTSSAPLSSRFLKHFRPPGYMQRLLITWWLDGYITGHTCTLYQTVVHDSSHTWITKCTKSEQGMTSYVMWVLHTRVFDQVNWAKEKNPWFTDKILLYECVCVSASNSD